MTEKKQCPETEVCWDCNGFGYKGYRDLGGVFHENMCPTCHGTGEVEVEDDR